MTERCDYYCGTGNFYPLGECVWGGYTDHPKYKNMDAKQLARASYDKFMASTNGHREILLIQSYTDCGIDLFVDPEFKSFKVTFIVGRTKKAKV